MKKNTSTRPTAKKQAVQQASTPQKNSSIFYRRWLSKLQERGTHRSFRRTRRRDYLRALELPGYFSFTIAVMQLLWSNKRLMGGVIVVFSLLTVLLGGLSAQDTYNVIGEALAESNEQSIPVATQIASLAVGVVSATPTNEVQQVYVGIMIVFTWLTTVWLLRERMAGKSPRLRDGLYSSGAPVISTVVIVLILLVQLIPLGLTALSYGALSGVGIIDQGLGAFLFFCVAALVIALTLYWSTTTFLALVIVTLPGMYPLRAMRAASDIVVGRRLRFLYRLVWLLLTIVTIWALTVLPVVALDQFLRSVFDWWSALPLVAFLTVFVATFATVWSSAYVYTLYRKVVSYDAA